jgi:hypothetical protein
MRQTAGDTPRGDTTSPASIEKPVRGIVGVAEDHWRVDCQNKPALIAEFRQRREGYRDVAVREARREREYYVYVIQK